MNRRSFVAGAFAALGLSALPFAAEGGPKQRRKRRRKRRRRRRRRRRRIRRRAAWRVVTGHRLLIVPVAVAVGWELALDGRIVIVTEVHDDHLVVEANGKTEKVDILKEDTKENAEELEGTEYGEEIEEDDEGDQ